jgi:hypothetical protein
MKPIILPLLAAALVCQAAAARAQTAPPSDGAANASTSTIDAGVVKPPRATLAVPFSGPGSLGTTLGGGAEIETGSDDGAISIWLSWTNSARLAGDKAAYDLGILKFSAPIDENASADMSAALDTLSNATSVEFKFSRVLAKGLQRKTPAADLLQAVCGRAKTLYAAKREVSLDKDLSCAAAAADDPAMNADWEDLFWSPAASALTYGLAGKVGHQKFDYLETSTLAEQSQRKAVWSVSGFVTHATRKGRLLVSAGFEHQDAYEAADQKTLCPAGPTPVVCAIGAYGAPVHKRSDVVSLEGRAIFGPGLGLVAKLNHDFNDDVWGVEVPVYFVRSPSKDALTGGLKFGWRSDDHDLVVSLFFGKAFPSLNF